MYRRDRPLVGVGILFLVPEYRTEKGDLKGFPLSVKESGIFIKGGMEGVFTKTYVCKPFLLLFSLILS